MSSVQAPQTKQKGPPCDHGRSWWKLWVVYKLLLELPSGKKSDSFEDIRTFHGLKQLGPHLLRRHQCWNTQMLRKKVKMRCCPQDICQLWCMKVQQAVSLGIKYLPTDPGGLCWFMKVGMSWYDFLQDIFHRDGTVRYFSLLKRTHKIWKN